jgi:hypothetical protein
MKCFITGHAGDIGRGGTLIICIILAIVPQDKERGSSSTGFQTASACIFSAWDSRRTGTTAGGRSPDREGPTV